MHNSPGFNKKLQNSPGFTKSCRTARDYKKCRTARDLNKCCRTARDLNKSCRTARDLPKVAEQPDALRCNIRRIRRCIQRWPCRRSAHRVPPGAPPARFECALGYDVATRGGRPLTGHAVATQPKCECISGCYVSFHRLA